MGSRDRRCRAHPGDGGARLPRGDLGPAGPVVLALPEDVLDGECACADTAPYRPVSAAPSAADASALGEILRGAQRPLVIAGGANWSDAAAAAFSRFVQAWNLPVACAFRRQDVFDNRDAHYAGHLSLGMNARLAERVRQADVILAFGTRLGDIATDGYTLLDVPRPRQRLIHLHADSAELGRVYQPVLAIQSGIEAGAEMLAALPAPASAPCRVDGRRARRPPRLRRTAGAPCGTERVDLGAAVAHLDRVLPDDAILSNGAGNYTVWLHRFYAYRRPRTELAPTCGAMGYGLPAAIAASCARPSAPWSASPATAAS